MKHNPTTDRKKNIKPKPQNINPMQRPSRDELPKSEIRKKVVKNG